MVVGSWSEEERAMMRANIMNVYGKEWVVDDADCRANSDQSGDLFKLSSIVDASSPATHLRLLYPALGTVPDPIDAYIEHVIAIYPVSSLWFKRTHVASRTTVEVSAYNVEIGKQIALDTYLRQCIAAMRYQGRQHCLETMYGPCPSPQVVADVREQTVSLAPSVKATNSTNTTSDYLLAFGFSDDDERNVKAISDLFGKLCVEHPQVKFVVYDTSQAGVMKKTVISNKSSS